jgi:hypothetical protein
MYVPVSESAEMVAEPSEPEHRATGRPGRIVHDRHVGATHDAAGLIDDDDHDRRRVRGLRQRRYGQRRQEHCQKHTHRHSHRAQTYSPDDHYYQCT